MATTAKRKKRVKIKHKSLLLRIGRFQQQEWMLITWFKPTWPWFQHTPRSSIKKNITYSIRTYLYMYSSASHNTAIIIREQESNSTITVASLGLSLRLMLSEFFLVVIVMPVLLACYTYSHICIHTYTTFNYTSKALKHFYIFFYCRIDRPSDRDLLRCTHSSTIVFCSTVLYDVWKIIRPDGGLLTYITTEKAVPNPIKARVQREKRRKEKNNKNIRRSSRGCTIGPRC